MYAGSFASSSTCVSSWPAPAARKFCQEISSLTRSVDAVALLDAHRAKGRADLLGLAVKLGVGEPAALAALVLGDARDVLAATGRDVVVDAVVREVGHPTGVPAECRRLPIQHALPLLEPRHLLGGTAPEALGVVGRFAPPRADFRDRVLRRHAFSRSLYRWILPVTVFGSSGTNTIHRGYLYGVMRPFTNALSSSASSSDGVFPFLSSTKAFGL